MNNLKLIYSKGHIGFDPVKAHEADAGIDLRCPVEVTVPARGWAIIDTDVSVLIPEGYAGMLKSKSGLNVRHGIRGEGVIDAGYTGTIVAKMYNDSDTDHTFLRGDKLIQLVIVPIPSVELIEGNTAVETERGANGFGSSGR